jgi:hypothetical protein
LFAFTAWIVLTNASSSGVVIDARCRPRMLQ